ncbi:MAG: hypothetical protein QM607_12220 [Microbacterium sp.]
MRGKAGLVLGVGVGYVLGTRAGRKRYEQIKSAANAVWQLDPVQKQVATAKTFAVNTVLAVPRKLLDLGIVRIVTDPDEPGGTVVKAADE